MHGIGAGNEGREQNVTLLPRVRSQTAERLILDAADQALVQQAVGAAFQRINDAAFADDAKALEALAAQDRKSVV